METNKKFFIWYKKSKINKNFKQNPWGSKLWINSQIYKNKIRKFKNKISSEEKNILNSIKKIKKNEINILDVGGGIGSLFEVLDKNVKKKKIKYSVLENKLFVSQINKKIKNRVNFVLKIPNKKFEIVNFTSSLHYIKNWKKFLTQIIQKKPLFILIHDLPITNLKTFKAYQKYYKWEISMRFQNLITFKNFFKKNKYKLIKYSINKMSKISKQKYFDISEFKYKKLHIKSSTFIYNKEL